MTAFGSHRTSLVVVAAFACALGCSGDRAAAMRGAGRTPTQNHAGNPAQGAGSTDGHGGSNADDFGSAGNRGSMPEPTAGAGVAGSGSGTNGVVTKPNPGLDANASFDWPESPPGGGSCEAGTYTGTFDCVFTDPSGLFPDVELMGPVSLTFSKSMDGEFLEITEGDFEAVGNDLIGGRAKIQGKLDCSSLMLDAMAVDGAWAIGDPTAPLVPGGALEGEITGTLDPATGTLSGQWNFADPDFGACPGTWSVMHTP